MNTTYEEIIYAVNVIRGNFETLAKLLYKLTNPSKLEELNLDEEQIDILHSLCINTVSDLTHVSKDTLRNVIPRWKTRGLRIDEIEETLSSYGLSFSDVNDASVYDPIKQEDMSVRTYNCLRRCGYDSYQQLSNATLKEIMHIRNFGKRSCEELLNVLKAKGYSLKSQKGGD